MCLYIVEWQEVCCWQIFDMVVQFFFIKGYVGMMMSDFCSVFGVIKLVVYYYFIDKYEIFDILCCEVVQICLLVICEMVDLVLLV